VTPGSPFGTQIVMWILIAGFILYRASRPQRISVTRMWVMAILLMFIGAWAIYGYEMLNPAPAWEIVVAVVLGVAAGIPVGMLRGHHTTVSATDKHGVMQLGPSWATALIYIAAFGVRAALHMVIPITSPLGTVVGDGVLVFAIAIVGATYWTVYRKYEQLDHAQVEAVSS
jgi:sugar phosphate permease